MVAVLLFLLLLLLLLLPLLFVNFEWVEGKQRERAEDKYKQKPKT